MDNTLFDFIKAKHAAYEAIVERSGLKDSGELFKYFLRGGYNFEAWENIRDYMKDRDTFDVLITADMTGTKKPSPEIFFYYLKKLQVYPHQALFIGDSLRRDIEPAKKIGMVTAYAAYGDRNIKEEKSCQADYCLNDISDVLKFIKSEPDLI